MPGGDDRGRSDDERSGDRGRPGGSGRSGGRGGPGERGGRGRNAGVRRGGSERNGSGRGGGDDRGSSRGRPRDNEDAKPVKPSLSGKPAPKRRKKAAGGEVSRPQLPSDRADVPGHVYREIKRTARQIDVNDVANAVATAAEAVATDDVPRAVELLEWAKTKAPRSISIREGLGVAYYMMGDFENAQRELAAYRRISGRADQNHLLADSARALGRPERVVEFAEEVIEAHAAGKVPLDRMIETVIVQAGAAADAGRLEDALAILERAPLPEGGVSIPHGRVWYAAGDLAERMGDTDLAEQYFAAAQMIEDDFMDAESRLDALS